MAYIWFTDPTPSITPSSHIPRTEDILDMAEPTQPSKDDLPDHIRKELEKRQGGGR